MAPRGGGAAAVLVVASKNSFAAMSEPAGGSYEAVKQARRSTSRASVRKILANSLEAAADAYAQCKRDAGV